MDWEMQLQMIGRVAIALFLGGLVGLEREFRRKPAGLRTHMLVTGASALLTCLGTILIHQYAYSGQIGIRADPTRMIQAIIIGIGFIGAGTIMHTQQQERVKNLTTAGSILFCSGIGIATAISQYVLAVGITLLLLIVNSLVGTVEKHYRNRSKSRALSKNGVK